MDGRHRRYEPRIHRSIKLVVSLHPVGVWFDDRYPAERLRHGFTCILDGSEEARSQAGQNGSAQAGSFVERCNLESATIDARLDFHPQVVACATADHAYTPDRCHCWKQHHAFHSKFGTHSHTLQYAAEHEAGRAVSSDSDESGPRIGIGVRLIAPSQMWQEADAVASRWYFVGRSDQCLIGCTTCLFTKPFHRAARG